MSDDPYATIAPYYDLEHGSYDADIELYLGYAGMIGSPILELGCGTGRLLVPLAQAGYDVSGIDSSPAMIELAHERLAAEGLPEVNARVGDMCVPDHYPNSHFRLVFAAFNAFLHLETRQEQLAALAAARRVLHHNGLLIVDIFQPTPAVLQNLDDQFRLDGQWSLPSGERIDRISSWRLHVAEQRIETTLFYDRLLASGELRRTVASYVTRYVHRFEMEGLLEEAGFAIEGIYGSYQLEPLDDNSRTMIFVAHRR
jgi:SAM-dependent methyltransferase